MNKSILDVIKEQKIKYNTVNNNYKLFPVGTRVKVIVPCQDFKFYNKNIGTVVKSTEEYLGIIVELDGYSGQHCFDAEDLIVIKE